MADDIRITIDNQTVRAGLRELAGRIGNLSPALKVIGERMVEWTFERFNRGGPAPDGTPWAPLKPATLKRKRGKGILRESDLLRDSVHYQLLGPSTLAEGSNRVYAAIQQLGGAVVHGAREAVLHFRRYKSGQTLFAKPRQAHFGQKASIGEHMTHIPARPYLGVSAENAVEIVGIINQYLMGRSK